MSFSLLLALKSIHLRPHHEFWPQHKESKLASIIPRQGPNWDNHEYYIYLGVDFYSHHYFGPSSKRQRIASMKVLMGTLRKEPVVIVTCCKLNFHLFKFLVLPTYTYGTKIWGGDLKNSHWKVSKKGVKIHMMSQVKMRSSTTYHILLAKFGKFPIEKYTLKLITGFQQWQCPPTSSWLINQATSLSRQLAKQGVNT